MNGPSYNNLTDALAIRLPGATTAAITLEFGALLYEFCDQTNAWAEHIPIVVTNTTVHCYEIEPDEGELLRLLNVVDANERPVVCGLRMPHTLEFLKPISQPQTYTANVALKPDGEAMTFAPEWLLSRYYNGMLDGILARMMSQIAKPYSSPQAARMHQMRYQQVVAQARAEVLARFRYRGQGWIYPQSFAVTRNRGIW